MWNETEIKLKLEKAAQGVAQCEVSAYARSCRRCVAAYWKEQTWRSQNCKYAPRLWTDLKTDFTNGFSVFSGRSGGEKNCFPNFLKLGSTLRPCSGKPLVLEVLCLEVGTSVASALTAETGYESMKCMCDVDMRGRVRMVSKSEICMFFNSGYVHDRNISIFRRHASTVTGNTLNEPNYGSVRQSRDSLHRDRHKRTKKSRKPLEPKIWKNARRRVLWHTTMPVSLV